MGRMGGSHDIKSHTSVQRISHTSESSEPHVGFPIPEILHRKTSPQTMWL